MLAQWLGKGEGRGDGFESLSTDISNKTKQLTFAHKKKKKRTKVNKQHFPTSQQLKHLHRQIAN